MRLGLSRDRVKRLTVAGDAVTIHYRAIGTAEKAWLQSRRAVAEVMDASAKIAQARQEVLDAGATPSPAAVLRVLSERGLAAAFDDLQVASARANLLVLRAMITKVEGLEDADGKPIELAAETEEAVGLAVPLVGAEIVAALMSEEALRAVLDDIASEGLEALGGLGKRAATPSESPQPSPEAEKDLTTAATAE